MCLKNLMLIVIFLPTILISTLFAEEPLELTSIGGSHSVGHDQNIYGRIYKPGLADLILKI